MQSEDVKLNLPPSKLSHLFINLRVNSQYSFRVFASTAVGDGEPTRVVIASTVSRGEQPLENCLLKLCGYVVASVFSQLLIYKDLCAAT